ncbi:MAG: hypothetical protein KAT77_04475 [Nanoarchaeota archaeon]|nr:hypothetical protein [Nanoarchaeota archaeon]
MFNAFKKSWLVVKKNKWLFGLIFLIQIVFIIAFFMVQLKYQVAMVENLNNILQPLEEANYNEEELKQGVPFLEDLTGVLNSWEDLKKNLMYLMVFSFLVVAVFSGWGWSLTHYMVKKNNILKLWGKFVLLAAGFFIPFLIVISLLLGTMFFQDNPIAAAQAAIVLGAVFSYFALASFGLMDLKWKKLFKKVFWEIGIKKFYWVLLVYLIIGVVLFLLGYLMYYAVNFWPMGLVVLFIILFVLAMVFGRILLINSLREIA